MNEEFDTPALPEEATPKWRRWLVIAGFSALFVLAFTQLLGQSLLAGKIYPGVKVAGINVAGMTYHQAEVALTEAAKPSAVTIDVAGKLQKLSLAQLGVSYDITSTVDNAYSVGRDSWWVVPGILSSRQHRTTGYSYAVDQQMQAPAVASLIEGSGVAPVNAQVVVDNGVPRIESDHDGMAVAAAQVQSAIAAAVEQGSTAVIRLQPKPQQAQVKAADLPPVVEQTKQLLAVPIVLNANGKQVTPSASDVGKWIAFDVTVDPKTSKVSVTPRVDAAQVKAYVQTLANSVDVAPVNKKITTVNGATTETVDGKPGSAIDQPALVTQLTDALNHRQPLTATVAMKPVAFKTTYNNTFQLDAPKYIEINLSTQHLWAYQDHQVVYESPLTSGATNYGFGTDVGLFSIYYKTTNTHLIGAQYGPDYNYDVFVQYWMPFNGGEGLHDASWRNGNFGGQDYKNGGSHGCVNLPLATAAWIYGWAEVGTPVWVHY